MFRHVGIVVSDIERMLEFYHKFLDLDILYDEIEEGEFLDHIVGKKNTVAKIIKLGKHNSTIVELLFFSSCTITEKTLFKNGLTHFALTVKNVDELFMKFSDNELQIVNPPIISENKKFKVFFGKDPENNLIEFVEIL